jgi:hypothetical protein
LSTYSLPITKGSGSDENQIGLKRMKILAISTLKESLPEQNGLKRLTILSEKFGL